MPAGSNLEHDDYLENILDQSNLTRVLLKPGTRNPRTQDDPVPGAAGLRHGGRWCSSMCRGHPVECGRAFVRRGRHSVFRLAKL